MKMTKIESARIVFEQNGVCGAPIKIRCKNCFTTPEKCGISDINCQEDFDKNRENAEAYIKRHQQKSKKRLIPKYIPDIQPDTTGSELKKIVMKPANTYPTPLDVAKIIRDGNYLCGSIDDCNNCPIRASELNSSCVENRKEKIDSYISSHEKPEPEPVCEHLVGDLCGNAFETCDKECLANSEILKPEPVIEPITIEELRKMICFKDEYIYYFNRDEKIGRVNTKHIYEMRITGKHIVMLCGSIVEAENYYKTLDEAVAVAKKNWGLE